jgi:hypothetical protein
MSLANVRREAGRDRARAAALIERAAQSALESAVAAESLELEQARARLRPALVDRRFVEDNGLAARPFAGEVWEAFVVDEEQHMRYVLRSQAERWRIGADQLHEQASLGLRDASRAIALEAQRPEDPALPGKYLVIATRDGYDAARLAVREVRDAIARELGSPFFAAIPNRDFLVAWSADYAFSDRFAEQVRADFERRSHPISPLVYRVDRDGVRPVR